MTYPLRTWLRSIQIVLLTLLVTTAAAQTAEEEQKQIKQQLDSYTHRLDQMEKAIDDLLWFQRLGDVARIDKIFQYGPPPANIKNPKAMGAVNPVKFWSYIFWPLHLDPAKKYPLLVFPHGGVHANFTTYYTHIVREMIAQGYVVVAPEYRGSTGYGEGFFRQIDYGGLEIDDVHASRVYMLENYDFIDPARVGIIGWSHGGLLALMNIFNHPGEYTAAFAGVPVSDLVARMGYSDQSYRELFSADHHIGQEAVDNVNEYRRRSPVFHVKKLKTPLLIHTNTNDDDVYVLEVEALINALKAEKKEFEYEIFQEMPGGHSFDRLDTKAAKQIRVKIYQFLARYLSPSKPIQSLKDLEKAGYR